MQTRSLFYDVKTWMSGVISKFLRWKNLDKCASIVVLNSTLSLFQVSILHVNLRLPFNRMGAAMCRRELVRGCG